MKNWDKGLDYVSTYRKLLKLALHASLPSRCYYMLYLIQLRNGSRIGEALEAFKQFVKEKKRIVTVRVEKRKDNVMRYMVLPEDLTIDNILECREWVDRISLSSVKNYIRNKLNINTHSLRYAFITYMLKKKVSPSIVSKITGHKNLNYILAYTQEKTAYEVLVNGLRETE